MMMADGGVVDEDFFSRDLQPIRPSRKGREKESTTLNDRENVIALD